MSLSRLASSASAESGGTGNEIRHEEARRDRRSGGAGGKRTARRLRQGGDRWRRQRSHRRTDAVDAQCRQQRGTGGGQSDRERLQRQPDEEQGQRTGISAGL